MITYHTTFHTEDLTSRPSFRFRLRSRKHTKHKYIYGILVQWYEYSTYSTPPLTTTVAPYQIGWLTCLCSIAIFSLYISMILNVQLSTLTGYPHQYYRIHRHFGQQTVKLFPITVKTKLFRCAFVFGYFLLLINFVVCFFLHFPVWPVPPSTFTAIAFSEQARR